MATEVTSVDDTHSRRRAWAAVVLLALVGMLNYADRFLPAVLAEPIKNELALSDTAIGIINGFGFLAIYAALGLAIARIADRGAFGSVVSVCLALWGAMTMLGGAVQSGLQLVLTRVGVAVGEAGSTPAAHAYVARNFAPERRAAPLAVITLAIPLASAASLIGGGLLAQSLGWRTAFVVMGAISVLVAPLVLLVLGRRQSMPAPVGSGLQIARSWDLLRKPSFLIILAGSCFVSIAGYSLTTFAPAYLMRARGMTLGEVGVHYGVASAVTSIIGVVIVGRVADRLSAKDPRWLLWLVVIVTAAMLPFSALAFTVQNRHLCVLFLALSYVVGTAYMAPTIAAVQRLARAEQRATASAIFLFFGAMAGSVGPLVTGLVSDALKDDLGAESLGRALLIVPIAQLCVIALFLAASRRFTGEIVDAQVATAASAVK